MKPIDKKDAGQNEKLQAKNDNGHLKTDLPLSEKDEVKQAEERTRRREKKALL